MEQLCPFCGSSIPPGSSFCPTCGTPLTVVTLPVGTKLKGRYSVGKVLGQGGFGITYMGGDITLSRPIAIKELFPEGCIRNQTTVQPTRPDIQNEFVHIKQRFIEEARLLARLNHPGIVKVYDYFEENNTAYMVMELLKGKSLRQLIEEEGRIEEQEALEYIIKVCEALSIVHNNGYLHRDIKPDNIFITEDGRIVLIDFGSAREFIAGRTKTQTVILTPGYAPLEQYSLVAERGPYTDIYALSATLYHMLTGEVPADAPARQAGMKLRSPREVNPKISQIVSDAVMAGLEMDYKKRPQSIDDFLKLFERKSGRVKAKKVKPAEEEEVVPSYPAFLPTNVIGYKLWSQTKGNVFRVRCINFSNDGYLVAVAGSGQYLDVWDLRNGNLLPPSGRFNEDVLSTAFASGREVLAAGVWKGTKIWCVKGDKLLHMLNPASKNVRVVTFSPDGQYLASGSDSGIVEIWRIRDGLCLKTLVMQNTPITSLAFSSDGSYLSAADYAGCIKIFRTRDWNPLQKLEDGTTSITCLDFSPDGGLLASGNREKSVKIWEWRSGEVKQTLYHTSEPSALTFSPNGSFIATGCTDGLIKIWRVSDGILLQELKSHTHTVNSIAFSPDGQLIVSGDANGYVDFWLFDEEECEEISKGLIALGLLAIAYSEQISPLIEQWSDTFAVAQSTPRINLPSVIPLLQSIRRQLERVETPPSFNGIREGLLQGMNMIIDGFREFASNIDFTFLHDYKDTESGVKIMSGEILIGASLNMLLKYAKLAVPQSDESGEGNWWES